MCLRLSVITTLENCPLIEGWNTWNYMSLYNSGLFPTRALSWVAVQPAIVKRGDICTQNRLWTNTLVSCTQWTFWIMYKSSTKRLAFSFSKSLRRKVFVRCTEIHYADVNIVAKGNSKPQTFLISYKTPSSIKRCVSWAYHMLRTFQYVITDNSFLICKCCTLYTR